MMNYDQIQVLFEDEINWLVESTYQAISENFPYGTALKFHIMKVHSGDSYTLCKF